MSSAIRQKGAVLVLALVFMIVLGRMASSALESAQLVERLNFGFSERSRALYAAESALLYAERLMMLMMQEQGLQTVKGESPQLTAEEFQQLFIADISGVIDSGFSGLSDFPRYSIEFFWRHEIVMAPGRTDEGFCGLIFRASATGAGRVPQSLVYLASEWHACCVAADDCELGVLQLRQRHWRELIP
jgi:Tfp pilus assembly protein PilX